MTGNEIIHPYPVMAREFPDYDQTTLPIIPAGWVDVSWHNDVCPSFMAFDNADEGIFVQIFVDYAKPEDREIQKEYGGNGARFTVLTVTEHTSGTFDTENWDEAVAEAEANAERLRHA